MTTLQKTVKYFAIALALILIACIIGSIISVFGFIGGFITDDAVADEINRFEISDNIYSLKVMISAADLTFRRADSLYVESNLKYLTVREENSTLIIEETGTSGASYNGAVLTVNIPEGTVFKNADISNGAGRLTAEELSADILKLELGAGEVAIDKLNAKSKTEINGGAGKITVRDGTLCKLDLDMGIGQLNLTAALQGECYLDLGIGESNLTLIGNKSEYTVEIEKALGNITVDGRSVSDFSCSSDGFNRIDIDGGLGNINLQFKK